MYNNNMAKETYSPIHQNLKKYNRESGKKTLLLIGILISLIVILTTLSLILITKPKILTSSIDTKYDSTKSLSNPK
jgi:hypothetical protein